jgi:hypothetical protein
MGSDIIKFNVHLNLITMIAIFLSLIFCLGCVSQSLAQLAETESQKTPQELYNFHIGKKKSNTAAAFISIGGGLAMVAGGTATNLNNCLLSGCQDGMVLVYSGIGVGLSSIYFFNRAGKHKKIANIQLQNGAVGLNNEFKYSGISIAFTF